MWISGMVRRLPIRTHLTSVRVRVMTPLSFRDMVFEYTWYCPSTHHRLGCLATGVRAPVGEPGIESGLSASSDEADCAAAAGAGTSADPEASFDHETPKEPDAPSSCLHDLEGVAGQCALLIRLGGTDYAGHKLFGHSSCRMCSS